MPCVFPVPFIDAVNMQFWSCFFYAAMLNRCQPACVTLWKRCSSRRVACPPRMLSRCWQPWRGLADFRVRPGPDHMTTTRYSSEFTFSCCSHVDLKVESKWFHPSINISMFERKSSFLTFWNSICDKLMLKRSTYYIFGSFNHLSVFIMQMKQAQVSSHDP